MKNIDLNNALNAYKAPEPSDLLKGRILRAASAQSDITAPAPSSFTKRFVPIAASLLAVCAIGFGVMQSSTPTEPAAAAWQEAALDLGFHDVYEWVETEESQSQ